MTKPGLFLDYAGIVDHNKINFLLKTLKRSKEFLSLDKTTRKRLYSILVECLENISRHSIKDSSIDQKFQPFVLAWEEDKKMIVIKSGNPIFKHQTAKLDRELKRVNKIKDEDLTALYDEIINKETKEKNNGAGLGFILMKSKSGSNIGYGFTMIDDNYSFFEINISLKNIL
jgi:hypothetical protein